jgi:hypothetical protein
VRTNREHEPGGADVNDVKPSEIIILVSGAVLLIFSFLDWYDFGFGVGSNAWDSFPLLTWPAIFGTAAAVLLALEKFANVNLPANVLGFTWNQLYFMAGVIAVLITLGALIAGDSSAIGLYLSLLGAIGLLVGAIMRMNENPSRTTPGSTPPQAF